MLNLKFVKSIREYILTNQIHIFDSFATDCFGNLIKFSRFCEDIDQWAVSSLILNDSRDVGSGEDPRAFTWRGAAYAYSVSYSKNHGFINKIFSADSSRWINLITPPSIQAGKNWSPFTINDELFFIHEFSHTEIRATAKHFFVPFLPCFVFIFKS